MLVIFSVLFLGCGSNNSGTSGNTPTNNSASSAGATSGGLEKMSPVEINIKSTPSKKGLTEVHVNVSHLELWLSNSGGKEGRLIVAEGLGDLDLTKLNQGFGLTLSRINLPSGLRVKKVRMVLNENSHFAIRPGGTRCDMQTPSAQQSGVKIILGSEVTFESGWDYKMTLDFDADKSVVVKGNGECLLKPVLKLPQFTKTNSDSSSGGGQEEPVTDGNDDNNPDLGLGEGFDISDPTTWPPWFTEADIPKYF